MSSSDVIAVGALILAIISVFIANKQLAIQQNHNKKSLKPLGQIDLGDYEDNLYAKITNYGLGPLIIESVFFYYGENKKSDLIKLLPSLPKDKTYKDFVQKFETKIIAPNNNICIFDILFSKTENSLRDEFREILKDITIEVNYKSIYDESITYKKELTWFERNLK